VSLVTLRRNSRHWSLKWLRETGHLEHKIANVSK
jgi:hypothetical protein